MLRFEKKVECGKEGSGKHGQRAMEEEREEVEDGTG